MVSKERVLDDHLGMITRGAAGKIAEGSSIGENIPSSDPLDIASEMVSVSDLLQRGPKRNALVEIEGVVYKVLSKRPVEVGGVDMMVRVLLLGTKEENVRVVLFDKKADLPTLLPIERGDKIIARNFVVREGPGGLELASIVQSTIAIESQAKTGVNEFSRMDLGAGEVDVVGKIVVIGPIKHSIFATGRDNDSCSFTISDGIDQMRVMVVGNAIRDMEMAHPGDPIKIERATVRKNGGVELYLNESSRILVSASLRSRLRV